jgi:prepilin-type N-terminal cleavage/methylation domain-containing protein/prepilin-type processing-associated H-X9-DG protein
MTCQATSGGRAGGPRTGHPGRTQGPGRGFTLVELLVVIGIIAILISILLPSLNQAKRKAQAVACGNQGRQIYLAMLMFAQDHKGQLPRPYLVGELAMTGTAANAVPTPFGKVCAWAQKVGGASGHIDFRDDASPLFKYVPGEANREALFLCPGDNGEALAGHPRNPAYPRNISYSMNNFILRDGGTTPKLGIVIGRVKSAAERIMIYEELAPNDSWCIMGQSGDDIPSGRHGINLRGNARLNPASRDYNYAGRGNHTFFDGHVEMLAPSELIPPSGFVRFHWPLAEGDARPGGFTR